tara:strand:- start:195 stop:440 length:246 start_codon:yes stop_codon:yes gene_type:complete
MTGQAEKDTLINLTHFTPSSLRSALAGYAAVAGGVVSVVMEDVGGPSARFCVQAVVFIWGPIMVMLHIAARHLRLRRAFSP